LSCTGPAAAVATAQLFQNTLKRHCLADSDLIEFVIEKAAAIVRCEVNSESLLMHCSCGLRDGSFPILCPSRTKLAIAMANVPTVVGGRIISILPVSKQTPANTQANMNGAGEACRASTITQLLYREREPRPNRRQKTLRQSALWYRSNTEASGHPAREREHVACGFVPFTIETAAKAGTPKSNSLSRPT
jgi:hypothetical protein